MNNKLRQCCWLLVFLLIGATGTSAQQSVSGRVVSSESLAPLSGAMIIVEGGQSALTDADGRFTVQAPPDGAIVVRMLGYAEQRVEIEGRTVINIALVPTALALDEVVVVGYGQQTRATVSGSVSSISAEDISRTSASTSTEAILGKIQGINFRAGFANVAASGGGLNNPANLRGGRRGRDARPGGAPIISIRNTGEATVIIDGVPSTAYDFGQLNSADIENISILKDASASIYGFRAANGVILVTTKRGQAEQRPQLRIDGFYGAQYLPRDRHPFAYLNTTYQHFYSFVEGEQNRGQIRSMNPQQLEQYRTDPVLSKTYEGWHHAVGNQHAPMANLNASLSGGGGGATYYLSLGRVYQEYVVSNGDNYFGRTNLQANVSAEPFTGFSVGAEVRGRQEVHTLSASRGQFLGDVSDGFFNSFRLHHPHMPFYANDNPNYIAETLFTPRSPVAQSRAIGGPADQEIGNISSNLWVQHIFPFGLQARGTFNRTFDQEAWDYHAYSYDTWCYDRATDSYFTCGPGVRSPVRHRYRDKTQNDYLSFTLSQSRTLGGHTLSGLAGYERTGSEWDGQETRAIPPTNFSDLISTVDVNYAITLWDIERRESFLGRFNYDYEQRYMIEALGRYDGTYLYAQDRRWGLFPGVSAAWRITEEPFLRDRFQFLNDLKFRASWGQAGREQGISPWGYLGGATFGTGGEVMDGQLITGVRQRGVPVTNLSWVTSTSRNIGFDFQMFQGRFSGEFDAFERKLSGLPAARYDVSLPTEVGYTLPNENLESDANRGLEFLLRYSDRVGEVTYSIAPNLTVARRMHLEVYNPRYGNSWDRYRDGRENRWTGLYFAYETIGQFQSMEEIINHPVEQAPGRGNQFLLPGDYIYKDVNGDGIINHLDARPIGWGANPSGIGTPILSYGANLSLSRGMLSFVADFTGGAMWSRNFNTSFTIPYDGGFASGPNPTNPRWRRADPFDDQSEWIPGKHPPLRRDRGFEQANNIYLPGFPHGFANNVSYLRLKRAEFGVNVPDDFSSKLGLSLVRLYTSAADPKVWAFYPATVNADPDQANWQTYPQSSTYNVGFSAAVGGTRAPLQPVPVPPSPDDN